MFKVLFSVGILSIPAVFSYVGSVPGSLLLIGFGALNTYGAFLLGSFRLRHAGIHVSNWIWVPADDRRVCRIWLT
jgi:hypothetical protein